MIKDALRPFVPRRLAPFARRIWRGWRTRRIRNHPPLTEAQFRDILTGDLELKRGDVAFVHNSMDFLHLDFPFFRILSLLREAVGEEGTLLFCTYPRLISYEFLASGKTFDVLKTPSYSGVLSEFARRQPGALRSLHPTKSVCAIGPLAEELVGDHHRSPHPYGKCSPYHRTAVHGGKIIGLGVSTSNLSFVHVIDDLLKDEFPVAPYQPRLFEAPCIDRNGQSVVVPTYAHEPSKLKHNIPRFVRKHIAPAVARDRTIGGMPFFIAHAQPFLEAAIELARKGVTIYPRSVYS